MWGKRILVICIEILLFILLIRKFMEKEEMFFMGIPMASEKTLRNEWGERAFFEEIDSSKDVLLFNGNVIPYDKDTNTYYIPQNVVCNSFEGYFTVGDERVEAFFLLDGYEANKSIGISEGHAYRIWINDESAATISNIVMSGLPVISIDTENMLNEARVETDKDTVKSDNKNAMVYVEGEIAVWTAADEDYGSISNRNSHIECKRSASGETITCKLRTKSNNDSKKISLLSMGKHDAWKLYKVDERDNTCLRMMMAFQMWNKCNSVEKLSIPCRFVELILNDEYQGLYILSPRLDEDYFSLNDKNMILKTENTSIKDKNFSSYRPQNIADFGLWVQTTMGYANLFDDMVILDEREESFFLPGKIEYAFGSFPGRYNYLSYQSEYRVLTASDFCLQGEEASALNHILSERWNAARGSFLSDEEINDMIQTTFSELKRAGFATRRPIGDEDVAVLVDGILSRYVHVDEYYDTMGE